mgnify:CR=1 FL=1
MYNFMPDFFDFVNISPISEFDWHVLAGYPMRIVIKGRVAYIVNFMHFKISWIAQPWHSDCPWSALFDPMLMVL